MYEIPVGNEINPEYLFNTSSYYTLNAFCGSMKQVLLANYSHYYGGAAGGLGAREAYGENNGWICLLYTSRCV